MLERLALREYRCRRNLRIGQDPQHGVGIPGAAPCTHPLVDRLRVVPARLVAGEAGVGEPVGLAHQAGPACEQRLSDHLAHHPAVPGRVDVHRGRGLAAVAAGLAVQSEHRLLDEARVADGQRGREQGALHLLPASGALAIHQREQGTERAVQRGAEVHVGRLSAGGVAGFARHVDRAGHRLAQSVESDPLAPRAIAAEHRAGHQHDARIDRRQGRVVEPHAFARGERQVGDHHVGALDQAAHHRCGPRMHRIQREGALVAVHLQEQRAIAVGRDRGGPAVLAALTLLDPDHVGAVLGEQCGAIGPRDVAAEVQYPDAGEYAGSVCLAGARCALVHRQVSWGSARPAKAHGGGHYRAGAVRPREAAIA